MKLTYEEPQMQIRKYSLPPSDLITTSGVDLGDGDHYGSLTDYNYFG